MEKFEKDRSYYENLYERSMIKRQKSCHNKSIKSTNNKEKAILNFVGFFSKMSDYVHRDETIDKWIEDDKKKDEFFEKTKPPHDIVRCKFCNLIMDIEDKDFWYGFDGKPDRVSFLYRCKKCNKGRVFYNNGEELQKEKEYCEKCGNIINYTAKFNGNMLIKDYKCNSCGNSYVSTEDYSSSHTEKETITESDIQIYGYNEKEAKGMKDSYDSINRLKFFMDEINERQQQEDYSERISKLNKYNLFQLEEYINKSMEKTEFKNFKIINKEQVKTYMKCDFEVYFTGNFGENTSKIFDKLVEKLLTNSNWKLQKNKTHEKLGVLNGVLFGYDNKNDLIELVKKV